MSFDDIDTNDVVDISASYNSDIVWSGGTLTAGHDRGADRWNLLGERHRCGGAGQHGVELHANDVTLDFLAAGETITFSFTVTATDNQRRDCHRHGDLHDHRHQRRADGDATAASAFTEASGCQRAGPERRAAR